MDYKHITKMLQQARELRTISKCEEAELLELKRIETKRLAAEQARLATEARLLEQKRQGLYLVGS